MATTRIIPMHVNKGKTIAQCLPGRTDYAKNPDKTQGGEYVSAYECDPATVDAEFLLSKRQYRTKTGREQQNDVIAYQLRQAFKPGEVTPEQANKIAYELAMSFTKGRHAFIVATHTDRSHIHSHIIFNSTSLDCTRKFRNFWGSTKAMRQISDRICLEHGLSIIENPKRKGLHYGKWLGDNKPQTFTEKLRIVIDAALEDNPIDLNAFLKILRDAGYEIKQGKCLSFKAPGQKKFTRLRSLGDGYSEEEIIAVLAGSRSHTPRKNIISKSPKKANLLVDIQAKLQAEKSGGYERWAKVFNLKQMAQTMNYLTEHKLLDYAELKTKTASATAFFHTLSEQIKNTDKRMAEIAVLRTHIINYSKTRDVYTAYRNAGYSKKFLVEHEGDIILHKAAKAAFDELGVKKLPTVRSLQAEYAELLAEKKKVYSEYQTARNEMKELLIYKSNVDHILGYKTCKTEKGKEHERS